MTPIKLVEIFCQQCGGKIERKRMPSGLLAGFGPFKKRKFCGMECRYLALSKHGDKDKIRYGTAHVRAELNAWRCAIRRCYDPTDRSYANYGGRGISVCQEWRDSFYLFLQYIGRRPSKWHSLDRWPDQNGNYEPGNVRWATVKEQVRNTRQNHLITVDGETKTLAEWSELTGIDKNTLIRLEKRGIDPKHVSVTHRVPGVSFDPCTGRFAAYIACSKRQQWIGRFDTREQAEEAVLRAASEMGKVLIPIAHYA